MKLPTAVAAAAIWTKLRGARRQRGGCGDQPANEVIAIARSVRTSVKHPVLGIGSFFERLVLGFDRLGVFGFAAGAMTESYAGIWVTGDQAAVFDGVAPTSHPSVNLTPSINLGN